MNFEIFNRRNQELSNDESKVSASSEPSEIVAARLQQECARVTVQFRTPAEFGYDPDERRWWIRIGEIALPENMSKSHTPLLILVPGNYPSEGPTDIFLPKSLSSKSGWGVGDIIGVRSEKANKGMWVRCHIPGIPWRDTDDLCRLIEELLAILAVAQKATMTLSIERPVDN